MIFQEEFRVEEVNPDGKKFDKVNRLMCRGSRLTGVELLVDVNSELFDAKVEDRLRVCLARHLSLDGHAEHYEQVLGKASLLDEYDYAMHGIAYKYRQVKDGGDEKQVEIHVSHGGLLARIIGEERQLSQIKVDDQIYTLIRRV